MQVDHSPPVPPYFTSSLDEIFDHDLFSNAFDAQSRASSPHGLLTPPQDPLPTSFPSIHDPEDTAQSSFYNMAMYTDDMKSAIDGPLIHPGSDYLTVSAPLDPSSSVSASLVAPSSNPDFAADMSQYAFGFDGLSMDFMSIPLDPSATASSSGSPSDDAMDVSRGINPQLVDTPSAVSDHGDEEDSSDDHHEPSTPPESSPAVVSAPAPPLVNSKKASLRKKEDDPAHEKLTLTIAPVKVGGHAAKNRKGTVQNGGVVKKSSMSAAAKEKENAIASLAAKKITKHGKSPSTSTTSTTPSASVPSTSFASSSSSIPAGPSSTFASPGTAFGATPLPNLPITSSSALFSTQASSAYAASDAGDDDDDGSIPQDWRPPPEVLAKMSSKEKRQLRNKISARNFRVRRKEYISTLEGDIAERDRLLEHFKTQLGSRESENLALRQEIAALKKALLEGRGGGVTLPPPAPLPEASAAALLASSSVAEGSSSSSAVVSRTASPHNTEHLVTANTQKDLPSSPRPPTSSSAPRPFWGGVNGGALGGGVTPVHTTLVPDMGVSLGAIVRKGLQENVNPALNGVGMGSTSRALGMGGMGMGMGGFDGFADLNPFTMKTLDAYRMHLWGKMAEQQHHHQRSLQSSSSSSSSSSPSPSSSSHSSPSSLGANLRPLYFSNKTNLPGGTASSSSSASVATNGAAQQLGMGATLSALLAGKHIPGSSPSGSSSYPTPPQSPMLNHKAIAPSSSSSSSTSSASSTTPSMNSARDQQNVMLVAMASQTIFGKLGTAFWDAFKGSPSSSSSSSTTLTSANSTRWDTDKFQRVLEGKAVLRVVDIEQESSGAPGLVGVGAGMPVKSFESRSGASGSGPVTSATTTPAPASTAVPAAPAKRCASTAACVDILEESMRCLTLNKKA